MTQYARYPATGGGGGGGGTVTSVGLLAPASILSVSGSPVISAGTITLSLVTQAANKIFAGPASGAAAIPTFRSLVAADIPLIPLSTGVTGVLPIANGGTNSSTALNNNRIIQSLGGALVEAPAISPTRVLISDLNGLPSALPAITASRALISDASGLPTASATTATEIGYVSGVTSSIQTQLNSKQNTLTLGNLTSSDITVSGGTGAIVGSGTSLTVKKGNLTESTSSVLIITGGTDSVLGTGTTIQVQQASTTQSGYLSAADYTTFITGLQSSNIDGGRPDSTYGGTPIVNGGTP